MFAGLSTGIGGLISLLAKHTNTNFLSFSLGLSAGMMLYVSFMEMMPTSMNTLTTEFGEKYGTLYLLLAFFGGIAFIALIDFLVPESTNPHEMHSIEDMEVRNRGLKQTGLLTTFTIAIHNFPEGMATFMSTMTSVEVGVSIAIAIAIHNIPEGIAVAVPMYHATGNRKKAFWLSTLSGLAEPMGALLAYLFLMPYWSAELNAIILAIVSGIMVYISLDELLPSAERYGKHHLAIIGVVVGMLILAVSLFLLI